MTEKEKKYYEDLAEDFWTKIEKEAAELEITVDYYLDEFFFS